MIDSGWPTSIDGVIEIRSRPHMQKNIVFFHSSSFLFISRCKWGKKTNPGNDMLINTFKSVYITLLW